MWSAATTKNRNLFHDAGSSEASQCLTTSWGWRSRPLLSPKMAARCTREGEAHMNEAHSQGEDGQARQDYAPQTGYSQP